MSPTQSPPREAERAGGMVDYENVQRIASDLRRDDRTSPGRALLLIIGGLVGAAMVVAAVSLLLSARDADWEPLAIEGVTDQAWSVAGRERNGAVEIRLQGEGLLNRTHVTVDRPLPRTPITAVTVTADGTTFLVGTAHPDVHEVAIDAEAVSRVIINPSPGPLEGARVFVVAAPPTTSGRVELAGFDLRGDEVHTTVAEPVGR